LLGHPNSECTCESSSECGKDFVSPNRRIASTVEPDQGWGRPSYNRLFHRFRLAGRIAIPQEAGTAVATISACSARARRCGGAELKKPTKLGASRR